MTVQRSHLYAGNETEKDCLSGAPVVIYNYPLTVKLTR